jgi:type I restriction enzyme S subunit
MTTETQKIPAGYKLTKIGVRPEDWCIKRIEELTPVGKQYGIVDGPFGSNLKTEHYRKSGIPIVTSGYVTEGRFIADEYLYVDKEKFKQEKRSAVRGGDIVMAKIGARCGASAILPADHPESILSGNALKITIDEDRFSTFFIWQILWDLYVKGSLELLRTTGAQPAISMANLKKYQIAIPANKSEQTIIASVLSDVNALIEKLEKLIAKKRAIKKGAMQELLSGKRRLPGFSGKWDTKRLDEIFSISAGRDLIKEAFSLVKDEVYRYPIYSNSLENKGLYGYSKIYRHNENCVTVTARGTIGCANARNHKFDAIGRLLVMEPIIKTNCFFMSEYINNRVKFSVESTGVPQLTAPQISKYFVVYPKPEEQLAIAGILTDLDIEISIMKQKIAKYRMLKQGMMQVLLTGKVRLV